MALYPIRLLKDKNRHPFFPFNTLDSVLVDGTNLTLKDVLDNIYTKPEINNMFATELSKFSVYDSVESLPTIARDGVVAAVEDDDSYYMYMYYDESWHQLTQKGDTGEQGPKGDTGEAGANWYDTTTLPPETTVQGTIKGKGEKTISLPVPSSEPIEIADKSECTGTADAPTAPAGKVCIYPIYGSPKVVPIPTGPSIKLNTKRLCEKYGKVWQPGRCIANREDGLTPISTQSECEALPSGPLSGGYGYTWNEDEQTCDTGQGYYVTYDEFLCNTSAQKYTWFAEPGCFIQGEYQYSISSPEDCEEAGGHQESAGCFGIDPSFTTPTQLGGGTVIGFYSINEFRTREQCLTPSQLVWIYGRCSVEEVGIDGSDVESSIRGFNIVSEDGNPYSVVWIYTSPEAI